LSASTAWNNGVRPLLASFNKITWLRIQLNCWMTKAGQIISSFIKCSKFLTNIHTTNAKG
jgi:hypothetical protein